MSTIGNDDKILLNHPSIDEGNGCCVGVDLGDFGRQFDRRSDKLS
jgi:hypothetical protein